MRQSIRGLKKRGQWVLALLFAAGCVASCVADNATRDERTGRSLSTISSPPVAVPCAARADAVIANSWGVISDAMSLVDSYQSSLGPYGGTNVGANGTVQAAGSIVVNGGTIRGTKAPNSSAGLAVVPVPANATPLPLGSTSPGSLNINTASDSITLAPGNYVVANLNVNFAGAIDVANVIFPGTVNGSPSGLVNIFVTGSLNLGGNENLNGLPANLQFVVTSSGYVNVNAGGTLVGSIYAPTSVVNLDSTVFGSVVGSAVTLNSGSAVHFDQSLACPALAPSSPAAVAPTPLPAPPGQVGCFIGTANGWVSVPCMNPATILNGFRSFNVSTEGLQTVASAGTTPPIVYGQVEATVDSIATEQNFFPLLCTPGKTPAQVCADGTVCPASGNCPCNATNCKSNTCDSVGRCLGGNQWGLYLNSNWFNCPSPVTGTCWDQFILASDGVNGDTAVCIETWQNGTSNWNDQNFCVGANGQQENVGGLFTNPLTTRVGPLKAGDFGNVAAYAYTSGGAALVGMVAQFSWVSNQDAVSSTETDLPNLIPGLYAVVTTDQYNLAQSWTNVAGGFLGMDNSAIATFANAQVQELYAISDCQGDVSADGPTCPSQPTLTTSNIQFLSDPTAAESNNLTLVQTPAVGILNSNLAVTEEIASTTGACLTGQANHLFVKDNNGDNGGIPSNSGGVPFWESPDIFVVPPGGPAPVVGDTPADFELTSGVTYNVYLQVHNEYGCNPVQGPISVFIDAADPDMGFENWVGVTPGATTGAFTTFGASGANIVPAGEAQIIGPWMFTPQVNGGHKCLIAAVQAGSEPTPSCPVVVNGCTLTQAFNSNQIAQRNLQVDDLCSYQITNSSTNTANLSLGISVTPATPAPGPVGGAGPAVSLTFSDPNSTFFTIWTGQSGITLSQAGSGPSTTTTVALDTSYVELRAVPLGAGQSPSVSINIVPVGSPPTVDVSTFLTNPMTGDILLANGGSCKGTAVISPPPPP
jgi:hypothetical protein